MKKTSHIMATGGVLAAQAGVFRALASPIRLAVVSLLYQRDMAVHDMTGALAGLNIPSTDDRTNVCKNLAVLRTLGIVAVRKEGRERIYTLVARCLLEAVRCTLDVIAVQRKGAGRPGGKTANNKGGAE